LFKFKFSLTKRGRRRMRIEARNGGTGGGGHRQHRRGQPLVNGNVTGMSHHDAQTTIYILNTREITQGEAA